MIHDITKTQYLKNPCGTCSVAFWKNAAYNKPTNLEVIHKQFYKADTYRDKPMELYFRISHDLKKIEQPNLKDSFYFQAVNMDIQKYLIVNLINSCYVDICVDEHDVISWTKTKVFDNNLWIFLYEKESSIPVALGIANYDSEIKDIEVVPTNLNAMKLYYNSGFDTVNTVTLCKNFDKKETICEETLGELKFKITKPN